jgi:hypothetical protein
VEAAAVALAAGGMMSFSPGYRGSGSLKAPFKTDRTAEKRRFAKSSSQLGPQPTVPKVEYANRKAGMSPPRRR